MNDEMNEIRKREAETVRMALLMNREKMQMAFKLSLEKFGETTVQREIENMRIAIENDRKITGSTRPNSRWVIHKWH